MTSMEQTTCLSVQGKQWLRPLDQLPPPASSSKPLTPFSIEDILNNPCVRRSCSPVAIGGVARTFSPRVKLSPARMLTQTSPLSALEELASKTFKGLEVSALQAAKGPDGLTLFGQRNTSKRRRKSRTAFTNQQVHELEKRFLCQKYLSPVDRDHIARQLALSNSQVITWFQNRRAKLKRDIEEMKVDVESTKAAGAVPPEKLSRLAELEKCAAGGVCGVARPDTLSSVSPHQHHNNKNDLREPQVAPSSDACLRCTDQPSSRLCSEDEDEEIDVGD